MTLKVVSYGYREYNLSGEHVVYIGLHAGRGSAADNKVCTVDLPDSVTLSEAYDGASPVGLQGHVICCSGR